MSTPTPTPAMFAGRKRTSLLKSDSSEPSSEVKESSEPTKPASVEKKPFVRKPHLTQNLREDGVLKGVMDELRESEQINRKHGWYDRNRNGNQHKKREQDRAAGRLRSQRKNSKEKK